MNKEIEKKSRRTWKWRNMVSFYLLFATIVLLISGVALYIAPPGRVAYATDWRLLGFNKEQWEAIHTLPGYIGTVFAVWHLILNWKALLNYLRDRVRRVYRLKAEFIVALLLTVIVWAGAALDLPPFDIVMDWGEKFSDMWEQSATVPETPVEEQEVEESNTAAPADATVEEQEVEESNTAAPADATVEEQEVEESSTTVPADATVEEQEVEESSTAAPADATVEEHEGAESGKWGQFTVEELCEQQGIPLADGLARLEAYGLAADSTTRIRTLADTSGYAPSDVANIILGLEPGEHE